MDVLWNDLMNYLNECRLIELLDVIIKEMIKCMTKTMVKRRRV